MASAFDQFQGLIDSVQGNSVVSGSSVAADSVVDFDPNAPAAGRGQGQKKRGYCFSDGFLDFVRLTTRAEGQTRAPHGVHVRGARRSRIDRRSRLFHRSSPFFPGDDGDSYYDHVIAGYASRAVQFNLTTTGVNSTSFGSPHVRCTPMGRACGEPNNQEKYPPEKHLALRLFFVSRHGNSTRGRMSLGARPRPRPTASPAVADENEYETAHVVGGGGSGRGGDPFAVRSAVGTGIGIGGGLEYDARATTLRAKPPAARGGPRDGGGPTFVP